MKIVDCKELALKKVKIDGNVIGKFGTFEIEQTFLNNTDEVLEVGYVFPIIETATVVGFEVRVGDNVLVGKCKEKCAAQKEYQTAMVEGNSAYLMEQKNDNTFKISVGKLDKNEEVKIKINYIDKFEIIDNKIQILIPTLVTPKYKSNITNNLEYGKVDHTVDFNIKIAKTLNRKGINSLNHKINLVDEEEFERVEVLDYDLSRDFKLDVELKNELSSNAMISKTIDDKQVMYLSFMPEILNSYEDSEKEYIFLIDVSGSMTGRKILETKKAVIECLKQIDVGDKFNIIAFESEFEAMNVTALEYNEENLNKAIEYVNSLEPRGGTEILNPIKFALADKVNEKIVLLFTDGQVGNENEIIDYVSNNINSSRLFPFGIDSNVNAFFIRKLGKVGNGKAELITPNEKIDDKIIRTFARIQTPLLKDLEINYGKNKLINEIKEENCLFNYEFFNVFAKIEKLEDDIELKGKILDKEYSWKINKEEIVNSSVNLELLFVKEEMARLEDYIKNAMDEEKVNNYKQMIIERAEKYNINSKYTSFITVYERENKVFDVPKNQETTLSIDFMYDMDFDRSVETIKRNNLAVPTMVKRCRLPHQNNFMMGGAQGRTTTDILRDEVEGYYYEFMHSKEKAISTYILFVTVYAGKFGRTINYQEFLKYLEEHKEEILSSQNYQSLLYMCYRKLENLKIPEANETLKFLTEDYRNIANTGVKIRANIKCLSREEIIVVAENKSIKENIDRILWTTMMNRTFENVIY